MNAAAAPARVLFSINSGRSGSGYLAKLLATASNASAFHEAHPAMAGPRLVKYPVSSPGLLDRLFYPIAYWAKRKKLVAVRRVLATLPPGHVYAETNHMFILSFYDVIMPSFPTADVILLRRYMPRVIKSFCELGMFAEGDTLNTSFWTTSPNGPSAALAPLAPDAELDPYDRCIAYLIDIEARAQRFIRRYPRARVVEARLERLNDLEFVERLFRELELEPSDATRDVVGRSVNRKENLKRESSTVTEAYCLERALQYVERCRSANIELPDLPQLERV